MTMAFLVTEVQHTFLEEMVRFHARNCCCETFGGTVLILCFQHSVFVKKKIITIVIFFIKNRRKLYFLYICQILPYQKVILTSSEAYLKSSSVANVLHRMYKNVVLFYV